MSKLLYDVTKWKETSRCWMYDVPQRDPAWSLVKIGRPSGSTIGYALGHSPFSTPEKTALDICCMKYNYLTEDVSSLVKKEKMINPISPIVLGKEEKSEESKRVMNLGTINETPARDKYKAFRGVNCEEIGYVIPKFNMRIGVSIDGDVFNIDGSPTRGIVEIKSPERMYKPIKDYVTSEEFIRKHRGKSPKRSAAVKEWKPKTYSKDYYYIWQTHYDQMQLGMAILDKIWCDYIVDSLDGGPIPFITRVYFDPEYWKDMADGLTIYMNDKINPLLAYLNSISSTDILKYGLNLSNHDDYLPQHLNFPLMPGL